MYHKRLNIKAEHFLEFLGSLLFGALLFFAIFFFVYEEVESEEYTIGCENGTIRQELCPPKQINEVNYNDKI